MFHSGMVKLLRRCLRDALVRTSQLVDQGVQLEKNMTTNVSVQLDNLSVCLVCLALRQVSISATLLFALGICCQQSRQG